MTMNSRNLIIGLVLVVVLVAGGIWLYNWVLGETEGASGPISAPTLALPTDTESVDEPIEAVPTVEAEATEAPVDEAPEPTLESATGGEAPSAGLSVLQIAQEESQVRFNIFEELRGSPKDVIGVSDQVAGELAIDLTDLSTAQVGVIQVNARTLATDDDRRNQAIRNRILFTDQYEFITFTPTEIRGLSGSAEPGQPFSFQIAGDLTIRDVTQPVVFEVSATGETMDRIVGTASTTINRADFNLIVPDVPFVANVGDEITLEIDFVLLPK
jgi:polyisoprenoid-binding protein YceI